MGTISSTRKNSKSNAQNVLNNNQKELIKHNNNSPLQQQTSSLPNDQENIDRAAATAHTLLVKTTTRTPKPCVSTTFKQAPSIQYVFSDNFKDASNKKFNILVDQILPTVRSVIMKNNEENPTDIVKLQQIAKDESLWLNIIFCLIDKIDLNDKLGPPVIAIFLEETPLPSKEQIILLTNKITFNESVINVNNTNNDEDDNKSNCSVNYYKYCEKIQRNILVILSCLVEKVAGTNVATLLADQTLDFTFNCLNYDKELDDKIELNKFEKDQLNVLLFALIALEKFSMSAQNKFTIMNEFSKENFNKLNNLAKWKNSACCLKHQIGFLSQYLLDNIFTPDNHIYDYLKQNYENTNVRLNDDDISENLKLASNGLEARNDRLSFESVRSTYQVDHGIWFYEVTLLTNGIMQIGFATKSASFLNHQGCGIGDDKYSVGYDGCRNLIWYNGCYESIKQSVRCWREGDVIGFLLDMDNSKICFYNNGKLVHPIHTDIFRKVSSGIFPAASFMSFQHVIFNFGQEEFKYPPKDYLYKNFNKYARIDPDKRFVLPKRKKLELLRQYKVKEDACTICCENIANIILIPCRHENICDICAARLKNCPICRSNITKLERTITNTNNTSTNKTILNSKKK